MEENPEFFYSNALGRYIAYHPLSIDDRVVKAAKESGVDITWDDEGRVNFISYPEAKALFSALGSSILSPREYWMIYEEAFRYGDTKVLSSLQSESFVEWFDVVLHRDEQDNITMIEHPDVDEGGEFTGTIQTIQQPVGRPGWFLPIENINPDSGMPFNVEKEHPDDDAQLWKYWSTFKLNQIVGAIRGFVTSSGTASFDLDIPYDSKQPVLMVRETREELVQSSLDSELLNKASELLSYYSHIAVTTLGAKDKEGYAELYRNKESILSFVKGSVLELFYLHSKEALKLREQFIDMLGVLHLQALHSGAAQEAQDIQRVA